MIVRAESGEVANVPTSDVIANSLSHPIVVSSCTYCGDVGMPTILYCRLGLQC